MIIVLIILACVLIGLCVSLVSTRKKLHAQELQLQKMKIERDNAIHESETKDLFVQNMSHEVRTPLNAVVGFAQLLAMPPEFVTEEERNEYSEHIRHNSNLLTMLIDDILEISDVQSGNYKVTPTVCPLNELCNIALSSVKYRVKANIDLKYVTNIPDDYTIYADPRRVQQVLINYLTNAIKHTQVGSITLTTSLEEHPGMITFSVEDTGEGVPIGQAKNIFRRFTKLNDFVQGTGLGLNICLTLAEKMGGQVFLDTSYIKGARFVFCLPIKEEE
ncbi:MAG: HAMP domain-containing histidine kinase [Prevotella sp.]|nr:HAMP domain-containing histidine kinase [Candidatus Prevotella equi]